MSEKRKKGYYFYRSLFFTMLFCIVATSVVMVFRYYTRYDQQINRVYEDEKILHAHIDRIIGDQLVYLVGNMDLMTKDAIDKDASDQASVNDNVVKGIIDFHNVDALIFLDSNNEPIVSYSNSDETLYQEIAMTVEEQMDAGGMSIDSLVTPSGSSVVTILTQAEQSDENIHYILAVLKMENILDGVKDLVEDENNGIWLNARNKYSSAESFGFIMHDIDNLLGNSEINSDNINEDINFLQNFSEEGLYTFSKIQLDHKRIDYGVVDDSGFNMYLVSFVPYDVFLAISQEVFTDQMQFGIMLYIILLALSYILSSLMNDLYHDREIIKHNATYDFQTGCYSKSAGIDFLSKTFNLAKRNKKPLTLAYLILNKLPESAQVKDRDHEASINKTIYNMITRRIRQSDFVIRMMDHEYLIVLYDCVQGEAVKIFNQIMEEDYDVFKQLDIYLGIVDTEQSKSEHLNMLIREAEMRSHRNRDKRRIDNMISRLDKNQS